MDPTSSWRRSSASIGIALATLLTPPLVAQEAGLEGHWEGRIETPGTPLDIDLDFERSGDAWSGDISIPAQNAKDLTLTGVSLDGRTATFSISGIPGDPTFVGEVSEDGAAIIGTFSQGGQEFPFKVSGAAKPADRARQQLDGFDELVEQALADFEVPGLALAIVVDGEVVLARGYGVRDLDSGEPVTEDTLFAIGSCTKAFTTFVLGTLVDEGLIEWDEPVATYIPWFRLQDDHASRNLTVRDLITHRSGLPRHDFLWYNADYSREELVRRLSHLQPFADLRERYHYQNLMFLTAGFLAEQVTGRGWEDLVRERILTPLGMQRSNFSVSDSQRDADHAAPHSERDDELQRIPFRDITTVGPAGSINSSVSEMARWLQLHLAEGKASDQILATPGTAREMFTPQTVMAGYPTEPQVLLTSYGLGWALSSYRGHYRAAHGGGIDGFIAMTTVMPLDGIGVIALSNRDGQGLPEFITRHALDRLLELEERNWLAEALEQRDQAEAMTEEGEEKKEAARQTDTSPSHALEHYAGEYEHDGYGVFAVSLDEGVLSATFNDISSPLEHWHYDTFNATGGDDDPALEDTKLLFRSDVEGHVSELVVSMDLEVDDIVFDKKPDAKLGDPDYLSRFTGSYVLGPQELQIVLKGDALVVEILGQPPYELEPVRDGEFRFAALSGFSLVFVMDGDQVVEIEVRQPDGVYTATPKSQDGDQ